MPNQSDSVDASQMPLIEHLKELRDRFVRSLIAALIGMGVAFFFYKEIWAFVSGPLSDALQQTEGELTQWRLLEGIFHQLKVTALAGILFASPIIFYQGWRFISPALYPKEKKFILPLAFASTLLFFIGVAFGFLIIFDFVFPFLLQVKPDGVQVRISIDDALSTITKLLLGFGFCFQLPVVSFFLSRGGLIDHRDMIKFFRYAIVMIFVVAAFLTPPDPVSQVLMAVPLTLLYCLSIIIAWIFSTKAKEDPSVEELLKED